jgi:hypothetical protein
MAAKTAAQKRRAARRKNLQRQPKTTRLLKSGSRWIVEHLDLRTAESISDVLTVARGGRV